MTGGTWGREGDRGFTKLDGNGRTDAAPPPLWWARERNYLFVVVNASTVPFASTQAN